MGHYLITGGCGFIGSHLVERLLADEHAVRILDDLSTGRLDNVPSGMDLVVGDMREPGVVEQAIDGVDGVFHLAAIASVVRCNESWFESSRVNLGATIGLFNACRRARVPLPVVYASSAAVYGAQAELPIHEDMTPAPLSFYGADKVACELHARAAAEVYGMRTLGLRFFNVFGSRQSASDAYAGVITAFMQRARAGLPAIINGDGGQTRDFVFVADVVECLLRGMMRLQSDMTPCAKVANVASGQSISILELARLVAERCGREVEVEHRPERVGEIRHSLGSVKRLQQLLGYCPVHSLQSGLAELR